MGEEIKHSQFSHADFKIFQKKLAEETAILSECFSHQTFQYQQQTIGAEIEAWLIDEQFRPASISQDFIKTVNNPLVFQELAQFNVELNSSAVTLTGSAFSKLHGEFKNNWKQCIAAAKTLNASFVMTGILPSVQNQDLNLKNISPMQRFFAINEQILKLRDGAPIILDIHGDNDSLYLEHGDVMLESAATSLQLHLQVNPNTAHHFYNICKIVSAPMVAIAANSPYLFGKQLWDETRIPLFEQSVSVGASDYSRRVTFGIRYAKNSLFECFEANNDRYPLLLPHHQNIDPQQLSHLRLHNGTIWRWNRPLIGVNEKAEKHLRIEHRAISAGPSIIDMIANMAFFYGLVEALSLEQSLIENQIPFETADANFYRSAKSSLNAKVVWNNHSVSVRQLILEKLLPMAKKGLDHLDIDVEESQFYLNIIKQG